VSTCRDIQELKGRQAKLSMDTVKQLLSDKAIKNKADRDRRVRELNEKNTKQFIEERKRQGGMHARQRETLTKHHQEQLEALLREMKKVRVKCVSGEYCCMCKLCGYFFNFYVQQSVSLDV
jgi:phosphatidylinositol phospholipase C beta